jgi:hypothetical protein
MSSGKAAQASEVKTTQLPAWVEAGGKENYELAKQISGQPLQQYGGQTVAGPSSMTQSAYDKLVAGMAAKTRCIMRLLLLYGMPPVSLISISS